MASNSQQHSKFLKSCFFTFEDVTQFFGIVLYHSYKKRKGSMETRAVLLMLIFLFELEIYLGWPYKEYIKTAKNVAFVRICLVEMNLRLY